MSDIKTVNITPSSVSSLFRVLDNRIGKIVNDAQKSTSSLSILFKAGSTIEPIIIPKISY